MNFKAVVGADEARGHALPPALGIAGIVEGHAEASLDGRNRDGGRPLDLGELVVERQTAALCRAILGAVTQAQRHQARRQRGLFADRVIGVGMQQDDIGADIVAPRDLIEDLHHAVISPERRLQRGLGGRIRGKPVTQRGRRVSGRLAHGKH
ncbi:hypothetical protein BROWWM01_51540 [Bradyrhizobium ottawaense]